MHPPDYTNREDRRGPLTSRHNGRGARAWLPELIADPGWVYLVSSPQGSAQRRVCWRCVVSLSDAHEGRARVFWQDDPPADDERCTRCERPYGERPVTPRHDMHDTCVHSVVADVARG